MSSPDRSRWFLIVVENLVPLLGVLIFGWSLPALMVLYWAENGLIGLSRAGELALAGRLDALGGRFASRIRINNRPLSELSRWYLVGFFLVHYGIFWFVHGTFVFLLFVGRDSPNSTMRAGLGTAAADTLPEGQLVLALIVIAISLGFGFWNDYVKTKVYEQTSPARIFALAYGRVFTLHVALIGGGFAIMALGSPLPAMILLIVFKTVFDLLSASWTDSSSPFGPLLMGLEWKVGGTKRRPKA